MSTTGKRKGKKKWSSADKKKMSAELDNSWQKLMEKHAPKTQVKPTNLSYCLSPALPRSSSNIPSKPDTVNGAVTIKQTPRYTGDKILGIGTMHKSNAVPIFSDDEAKDISKMRR
jgi:hypothetical protein